MTPPHFSTSCSLHQCGQERPLVVLEQAHQDTKPDRGPGALGQWFQAQGRLVRVSCAGPRAGLGDPCVSSSGYSTFLKGRSRKVELE